MTAVTLNPTPHPKITYKQGTCTIANNYTSSFGFGKLLGVVLTSATDNDAIVSANVSSGSATVGAVDDAGSAIGTGFTANYIAWGLL